MLNKNEFLLLGDFSDYNRFPKFQPIDDRLHVNERFSNIIDHRNNTSVIVMVSDKDLRCSLRAVFNNSMHELAFDTNMYLNKDLID